MNALRSFRRWVLPVFFQPLGANVDLKSLFKVEFKTSMGFSHV